METLDIILRRTQTLKRGRAHAGHDTHTGGDVGAIRDFDANLTIGRGDGPHDIRHDVQRAVFHRSLKEPADFFLGFRGGHPVIIRTGVFFFPRTHKGQVLGARHISGITPV